MNRHRITVWIWVLVLFQFSNSFAYKKVKSFVLMPPKHILPGVERIALLDFQTESSSEEQRQAQKTEDVLVDILGKMILGDEEEEASTFINYGKIFSEYLTSELLKKNRGIEKISTGFLGLGSGREGTTLQQGTFTNVYDIVERNQLKAIIQEQELGLSGLVDEEQTVQLGKMLGVQAMVTGNVNVYHKDTDYKDTRTKKDKNKKEVKYKVKCKRREVMVKVRIKVVSAETGRILATENEEKKIKKNQCEGDWGSLPSVDEMVDEALKGLVTPIANSIAPHYKLQSYELEKVGTKKYKSKAEKAAKAAEKLEIDKAYLIYKAIFDKDAYQPKVIYNIGVMNEVVGNFRPAEEMYEMAFQLKDEGDFEKALKRVRKTVRFADALAEIGIKIEEHDFTASAAEKARALANKAKIKGDSDHRKAIYAEPNATSEVVARVPGGLRFTVLQKQGDWLLLELLGGKRGFIHKKNVELE